MYAGSFHRLESSEFPGFIGFYRESRKWLQPGITPHKPSATDPWPIDDWTDEKGCWFGK
jgi:hypothetical protein